MSTKGLALYKDVWKNNMDAQSSFFRFSLDSTAKFSVCERSTVSSCSPRNSIQQHRPSRYGISRSCHEMKNSRVPSNWSRLTSMEGQGFPGVALLKSGLLGGHKTLSFKCLPLRLNELPGTQEGYAADRYLSCRPTILKERRKGVRSSLHTAFSLPLLRFPSCLSRRCVANLDLPPE